MWVNVGMQREGEGIGKIRKIGKIGKIGKD